MSQDIRQRRTSLQQPRAMAVRGPREIEDFGGCKYDNAELHCSNLARWQCGVPAKSKISGGANTTTPNFIAATSRDGSAGSPRNRRFRGVQIRQRRTSLQQPRAMAVRGPREIEDFGGCKYDNAELHCSNLARWQCRVPAKSKISGGANTTTPNFICACLRRARSRIESLRSRDWPAAAGTSPRLAAALHAGSMRRA